MNNKAKYVAAVRGNVISDLTKWAMVAGIAIAGMAVASAANAQQQQVPCGERGQIAQYLASNFSETPAAQGLTTEGALIEVFASNQGNWTIVMTAPNRVSCLLAHGEAWNQGIIGYTAKVMPKH